MASGKWHPFCLSLNVLTLDCKYVIIVAAGVLAPSGIRPSAVMEMFKDKYGFSANF